MPIGDIYNLTAKLFYNIYNQATNPVSPYRSCFPPHRGCYTSEISDYNMICLNFPSFKKKTKIKTLEIE